MSHKLIQINTNPNFEEAVFGVFLHSKFGTVSKLQKIVIFPTHQLKDSMVRFNSVLPRVFILKTRYPKSELMI